MTEAKTGEEGTKQGGEGDGNTSMLDISKVKGEGAEGKEGAEGETKKVVEGDPSKKVEGEGDKPTRPAWLTEDKFWDAEKGEVKTELAFKNLQELQKMVSKGDHKAPEKPEGYKINLKDEQKELLFGKKDADPHADEGIKALTGWGVKHKVSQAALDEVLGMYAEMSKDGLENSTLKIDVAAEKAKLGKNADAVIEGSVTFLNGMFRAGEISEPELKEAQILFETAAGVTLFQKLMARAGEKVIPTDLKTNDGELPSGDELAQMLLDKKYETDEGYRKKVDGLYAKRYGTAPAMSSQARG